MTGPLVYISGPITPVQDRTLFSNIEQAWKANKALLLAGIPCICPHLSADREGAFDISHEHWMDYDLYLLSLCRVILMLPGWQESKGAVIEHGWAERQKLRICYSMDEAIDAVHLSRRRTA